MSLIDLYSPLGTPDNISRFVSYNFADHIIVLDAILLQNNKVIPMSDIRSLSIENISIWGLNHQGLHDATNAELGLAGSNFIHVDLTDPEQVASMQQLHAEEHRKWHEVLGI